MSRACGQISIANVKDGDKGDTGKGIASITEEYYLSTSKTTQTGGSWSTTPPTWSTGKYVWTRSKIVYKDPASTEYTTPICDSSWEAVNEVQGSIDTAQTTADDATTLANDAQATANQATSRIEEVAIEANENLASKANELSENLANEIEALRKASDEFMSSINDRYTALANATESQLNAYKAEAGQYMEYNDDGLSLGAKESQFKTVIDNQRMAFKDGDTTTAYISNKQLYIEDATVKNSLTLGNFFISPRDDGGVSIVWQEGGN